MDRLNEVGYKNGTRLIGVRNRMVRKLGRLGGGGILLDLLGSLEQVEEERRTKDRSSSMRSLERV